MSETNGNANGSGKGAREVEGRGADGAQGPRAGAGATAARRSHWSTRELVTMALFAAMVMVLSFIEIPSPFMPYLKWDLSGVISLICGLMFGPVAGVVVTVVGWLPKIFMDPLGVLVAICTMVGTVIVTGVIYGHNKSRRGAVVALAVGAVVFIALAIVLNLLITPLYTAGVTVAAVAAMIVPILLPFNIIKAVYLAVITFLLYKPVSNLVKGTNRK
ncbi:MAG: ECF transporter S component [Coriobacteriales bacterium]|jgi:riboflavin transporter FmnP